MEVSKNLASIDQQDLSSQPWPKCIRWHT